MAKLLLNKQRREACVAFVRKNAVPDNKLVGRVEMAYTAATMAAQQAMDKECPPADMKVLAKHGCTNQLSIFGLDPGTGNSDIAWMDYREGDRITAPDSYRSYREIIPSTKAQADKVRRYLKLRDDLSDKKKQMIADFEALIAAAKEFDELVTAWPKFEEIKEQLFAPSALLVLNDDVKERISGYQAAA